MNANKIFIAFEQHANEWIKAVEQYSDQQFEYKPSKEEWSLGEVLEHISCVTRKCMEYAKLCADRQGETGHSGIGPAIFSMMGAFPPVKIKVKKIPEGLTHIYAPASISREDAIQKLKEDVAAMRVLLPLIQKANTHVRIKHWAGGWFNSKQWYHSAEMHIKHHFRQRNRLDKKLQG